MPNPGDSEADAGTAGTAGPGHGLGPDALARTLTHAFSELSGPPAAVELLHRTGNWLTALDEAGFVEIGPPHPDDPDARPRARIAWEAALAATDHGGALTCRSLHVDLDDEDAYGVEPDPDQPRPDLPVLRLAAGLAGAVPVDLCRELSSLDRPTTAVLLAAISSATQAHVRHHRQTLPDGRPSPRGAMTWVGPLYDWDDAEAERRDRPDGPWRQDHLPLHPVAEEEAATARAAHANPYPQARLPLSEHLQRVLAALRPGVVRSARGRGGRRGASGGADGIATTTHRLGRAEVEDWLGVPLPSLRALEEADQELVCFTDRNPWTSDSDPLPARGSLLPNGEPVELSISLLWVPAGTDLSRVTLQDVGDRGWTSGLVRCSPFTRDPDDQPTRRATSLTEPAGGYTGISVDGTRTGVQHSSPGRTRIGWSTRGPDGTVYPLALHVPLPPVPAVELVLRGWAP